MAFATGSLARRIASSCSMPRGRSGHVAKHAGWIQSDCATRSASFVLKAALDVAFGSTRTTFMFSGRSWFRSSSTTFVSGASIRELPRGDLRWQGLSNQQR